MYILTTDSKTYITVGNYSLVTILLVPTICSPFTIKNFNHHPIHGTDWELYNFWPSGMFVWRMKMLNIYFSSYPKGPVALEIKFFKWKFGPTCPLKTQLSLTTIESPNIHSHHASFELEELDITKNPHNIAPYLKINPQTHAEFCPFSIMAIRRVSVFLIPDLFQRHTSIFFPDKSMAIWALLELDNISRCSIARLRFSLFFRRSLGLEWCGHILLLCLGSWKICWSSWTSKFSWNEGCIEHYVIIKNTNVRPNNRKLN